MNRRHLAMVFNCISIIHFVILPISKNTDVTLPRKGFTNFLVEEKLFFRGSSLAGYRTDRSTNLLIKHSFSHTLIFNRLFYNFANLFYTYHCSIFHGIHESLSLNQTEHEVFFRLAGPKNSQIFRICILTIRLGKKYYIYTTYIMFTK